MNARKEDKQGQQHMHTAAGNAAGARQAGAKPQATPLNRQPRQVGLYQLGEVVGRGACGKVYKAFNFQTGQLVAIKQIKINNFREEQKQALQMEINLLKKLEHPNIVKYIDSLYADGHLNIILEFVENGSLDSLMKKFGKLPETLVAVYVKQVLQGLDYLHNQGVIHRDIKGGNILNTKDGLVKLADFGVATKLTDQEKGNQSVAAGTPYWMAPEVIEMSGQITSACDIWSLGCTVIELLTSNPPYHDLHQCPAMIKIVQEGMPPLPENISEELKDFLCKCFEKDPFKRIDAKGLLEHPWQKKYDATLFQKLISNKGDQLPEIVSNTIKQHIHLTDGYSSICVKSKDNSDQSLKQQQEKEHSQSLKVDNKMIKAQSIKKDHLHNSEEDEDGEIGEFGEEINDMNDVPIERPKCLSHINFNSNISEKQQNAMSNYSISQHQMIYQQQQQQQHSVLPVDKIVKLNSMAAVPTNRGSSDQQPEPAGPQPIKMHTSEFGSKRGSLQQVQAEQQQIAAIFSQKFELNSQDRKGSSSGLPQEEGKEINYQQVKIKQQKQKSISNSRSGLVGQQTSQQTNLYQGDGSGKLSKQGSIQQIQLKTATSINQAQQSAFQGGGGSSMNPPSNLSQPSFSLSTFNSQQRDTPSQRQSQKSQDKSAGPGSGEGGNGMPMNPQVAATLIKQNISQSSVILQREQHSVFDVQGNRKAFYLTKKSQPLRQQIQQAQQLQQRQQSVQSQNFQQQQQMMPHHEQTQSYSGSASGANPNDESQLSMSLSGTNRQKRIEQARNKRSYGQQQQLTDEQTELLLQQQQQYQSQQREMIARYHQQNMQNPHLSGGSNGNNLNLLLQQQQQMQLYQKAKSNDVMMMIQTSPHGNNQPQFIMPGSQHHQHHLTSTTTMNFQSKQSQGDLNFQFPTHTHQQQHNILSESQNMMLDPSGAQSSQEFYAQGYGNRMQQQQMLLQQQQQMQNRSIQHQHNFTQMPHNGYSGQDHILVEQRSPMGSQHNIIMKRKDTADQTSSVLSKNYHSSEGYAVMNQAQNSGMQPQLNLMGYMVGEQDDFEDPMQLYENKNIEEEQYSNQDDDYQLPLGKGGSYMFAAGSADFNMNQRFQQQQQQPGQIASQQPQPSGGSFHQRFGSSYSQMNFGQQSDIIQAQMQLQSYTPSNIEEHIKRTQLSEQKHGRVHLSQLYGGSSYPFHHIQKKSVISNFQGSSGSPKNMQPKLTQPLQPTNNVQSNPVDSSFENYFETISNNGPGAVGTANGAFYTTGEEQQFYDSTNIPMINMQDLMNVRESYCKKLTDEEIALMGESDDKKMGFMMMLAMGHNEQQIDSYMKKMQVRGGGASGRNPSGGGQQQQQHQQFQSIGSGRSNYSVSQQRQLDNLYLQQLLEESQQYSGAIKTYLAQLERVEYEQQDKEVIDLNKQTHSSLQTQPQQTLNVQLDTEENKTESDRDIQSIEQKLIVSIRKLTQFLKDYSNLQFKDQIVKSIGYTTLITLLKKSDDVAYPTLQLINQICEKHHVHQELMCLCGFIPFLIKFGSSFYPREISVEVAYFIGQIFSCQSQVLPMLISNQGLQILIDFLEFDFEVNKDLVLLAIDSFLVMFDEVCSVRIPYEDLSILLCRMGLLENVAAVIPKLIKNIETSIVFNEHSQAEKFLGKAFDVLQKMVSEGPVEVKVRFCQAPTLKEHLIPAIENTINEPSHLAITIIKRFIKLMQTATQTQQTYLEIEKNDLMKLLVDMLTFFMQDLQHIQLQLIYDTLKLINVLCKLSPSRTEQAAMATLLAPLKDLALYLSSKDSEISRSKRGKLLKYQLSIIQEFIVASNVTRQLLIGYQIQQLLLSLISQQQQHQQSNASKDQTINAKILDIFVLWLQTDSSQIEAFLAKKTTLDIFFNIFLISPRSKVFLYVFNALNRMVQLSPAVAKSIAQNPAFVEKLSSTLLQIDSAFTTFTTGGVEDVSTSKRGHHHSKNSSSARSFNNILQIGLSQANLKTLDGQVQQVHQSQKSSQQAQIMKELMEIFQTLTHKTDAGALNFIEKNNLQKVFTRVLQTSESNSLVILQQIAQNILTVFSNACEDIRKSFTSPQDQSMILKATASSQQQQQQQQQLVRQNTGTHSTRSKSPLYQ